MKISSRFR